MGNLIWTGILYFSTFGIVFVTYRVFVQDRKVERESKTQAMVNRVYQQQGMSSDRPAEARRIRA